MFLLKLSRNSRIFEGYAAKNARILNITKARTKRKKIVIERAIRRYGTHGTHPKASRY